MYISTEYTLSVEIGPKNAEIPSNYIKRLYDDKSGLKTYSNLGTLENKACGASIYATQQLCVSSFLPTYHESVKENRKEATV